MKRLILICLLVCSCNVEDMKKASIEYDVNTMSTEMRYYKDTNTNLCFAASHIGTQMATMTNVPCTPEVEKVAHSFASEK